MSTPSSPSNIRKGKGKKPLRSRPPSASEIARNIATFEIWSTHQACEQVSYVDLPAEARADVEEVFKVSGKLPMAWLSKSSREYQALAVLATPDIISFIQDAFRGCPDLFSDNIPAKDIPRLYTEVCTVFSAWKRLAWMRKSKEKWSEHDYAANVYNVFRSPAIRNSSYRVHCTISLSQPPLESNLDAAAARVLGAKTAIPDCAIMIPAAIVRTLSHAASSPFKVLSKHPAVTSTGTTSRRSSFRFQSTPCLQLPDTAGFEFTSSFWEDKKPAHELLEDAYRQNRLATTAALRHLHSLCIRAPVFGLVWADGIVRAHVDWCKREGKHPTVLSAPYPGLVVTDDQNHPIFHEWHLEVASQILQVHFLIQNIDRWTVGRFRDRVISGVNELHDNVVHHKGSYEPWRRAGDLGFTPLTQVKKENVPAVISITTDSSVPHSKPKGRRRR